MRLTIASCLFSIFTEPRVCIVARQRRERKTKNKKTKKKKHVLRIINHITSHVLFWPPSPTDLSRPISSPAEMEKTKIRSSKNDDSKHVLTLSPFNFSILPHHLPLHRRLSPCKLHVCRRGALACRYRRHPVKGGARMGMGDLID